jgi:hypothetical protein
MQKLEYCKMAFYVFVDNKTVLSCTLLSNFFWNPRLNVTKKHEFKNMPKFTELISKLRQYSSQATNPAKVIRFAFSSLSPLEKQDSSA